MKRLKIQNLILIEKAEIAFGPGLNILTGETGSGKSAILTAIRLIAGGRADQTFIRKGADFAVVEAVLEGPVLIRREIYRNGKNRCFIDDAQVSLSALKEAANIEMADQNLSQNFSKEPPKMLDTFADILDQTLELERSFSEEKTIDAELKKRLQIPKERELEWARKDLALIEEVDWRPEEETKLSEEHHLLSNAQQITEKISAVSFTLNEEAGVSAVKKTLACLEGCARLDPRLKIPFDGLKSALLELEEVGRFLQKYLEDIEFNPSRLAAVEKRIASIEALKRRFGTNLKEQKEKLTASIEQLDLLDDEIKALERSLENVRNKNKHLSESIQAERQKTAPALAARILEELQSLNIPSAQFEIAVGSGLNDVQFLFSANPGIAPLPLEQCASGGELSRLLLAIKTILANGTSCLVFDEIDSNVGGQTAAILGQKLQTLAETRQVICVTHFVQVAKCATDHFLVYKSTCNENAYTHVIKLDPKEKESEYHRMLGASYAR